LLCTDGDECHQRSEAFDVSNIRCKCLTDENYLLISKQVSKVEVQIKKTRVIAAKNSSDLFKQWAGSSLMYVKNFQTGMLVLLECNCCFRFLLNLTWNVLRKCGTGQPSLMCWNWGAEAGWSLSTAPDSYPLVCSVWETVPNLQIWQKLFALYRLLQIACVQYWP